MTKKEYQDIIKGLEGSKQFWQHMYETHRSGFYVSWNEASSENIKLHVKVDSLEIQLDNKKRHVTLLTLFCCLLLAVMLLCNR